MKDDRRIAIRATNLSKTLGGRTVLRRITLDISEGQRVALLGANGAGKTTLLRCLAGSLGASGGQIEWLGNRRRLVGSAGHESQLYSRLTLRENLVFAARMCDVRDPAGRADQLLDEIGLRRYTDRLPGDVSRGMRQRVSIARAIVHAPPILLLDEPFSGLDEPGSEWLSHLLAGSRSTGFQPVSSDKITSPRTVCFTTHDRDLAERLADRLIELQAGQTHEISASSSARRPSTRAA